MCVCVLAEVFFVFCSGFVMGYVLQFGELSHKKLIIVIIVFLNFDCFDRLMNAMFHYFVSSVKLVYYLCSQRTDSVINTDRVNLNG